MDRNNAPLLEIANLLPSELVNDEKINIGFAIFCLSMEGVIFGQVVWVANCGFSDPLSYGDDDIM
jgi:hypothetical protein